MHPYVNIIDDKCNRYSVLTPPYSIFTQSTTNSLPPYIILPYAQTLDVRIYGNNSMFYI